MASLHVLQPVNAKRTPNQQEQDFILLASKIKDGRSSKEQVETASIGPRWLEIASELYTAYQEDGLQGFWTVYEVLSFDTPHLKDWRDIVETPAPLEDGKPLQVDKRFIVDEDKTRRLKLESIEDIYQLPKAEYLIRKVLESASTSLLYGVSGTGKTFTVLNLALSIAHGLYWFGRKTTPGPVLFVNTEGGRGLKKRLMAWYREHEDLHPSPNFKIISWPLDLKKYLAELQNTLAYARAHNEVPVLIVLDNFSMCVPGIEQNKQEQVAPVLRELSMLASEYGSHIMIVHHTNRDGDFNGTMAFRNHVDSMIELKKEDATDKASPIVFSSQKARDDEPFADIRTSLKTVNLYYDEEEQDFVTSCVVVSCDSPAPEKATPDTQIKLLELLNAQGGLNCSQWAKLARDVHGISEASFYRIQKRLKEDNHIWAIEEKKNGKRLTYAVTETGRELIYSHHYQETVEKLRKEGYLETTTIKPLSPLSNHYHDSGDSAKKPLSPLSHPFRGDSGDSGFLATPEKLLDSSFSGEELEEPEYIQDYRDTGFWDREE